MVTVRQDERGDAAVSEVVGSTLLVAITVVLSAVISVGIAASLRPTPHVYVDLTIAAEPGEGGWGTGDEALVVRHIGGSRLTAQTIRVFLEVDGARTTLSGAALGSAFADGSLVIGERWTHTTSIASCAPVGVDVVYADGGSTLLATQRLTTPGCPGA